MNSPHQIKLYGNFSWKSEKKNFNSLFKPFLINWRKNEDEYEKYGKMSSIFGFSISKLGYMT